MLYYLFMFTKKEPFLLYAVCKQLAQVMQSSVECTKARWTASIMSYHTGASRSLVLCGADFESAFSKWERVVYGLEFVIVTRQKKRSPIGSVHASLAKSASQSCLKHKTGILREQIYHKWNFLGQKPRQKPRNHTNANHKFPATERLRSQSLPESITALALPSPHLVCAVN